MDKEMLKILNDLSKKSTTELALKIMELSSENLILEQQCKKQKEVIDKAIELNQIINNSDYVYSQDEITTKNLDILKEVSE